MLWHCSSLMRLDLGAHFLQTTIVKMPMTYSKPPLVKKLLLAGILLGTQNLNKSAALSMARDSETVQLLSVGSAPNYSNALYDQYRRDGPCLEAMQHNYGRPPNKSGHEVGAPVERRISQRKTYHDDGVAQNGRNPSNLKNGTTNRVSPKIAQPKQVPAQVPSAAPTQAADASGGKNKFFLAKWLGFGSNEGQDSRTIKGVIN